MKQLALILMAVAAVGCVKVQKKECPQPQVQVIAQPAPPPDGVTRYCWQEPEVKKEQNGPGLSEEGTWYQASHTAVREVKMGRWVPCK